jgi:glutamate dehydrogenase/leucine dehydrogenase
MRAVRDALDGTTSLDGLHVVVHGTGHVGSHLARLLAGDGARLTLADRAPGRAEALAAELGVAVAGPDAALDLECDVLAPCALGPVIDVDRVARLQCRAVCGAANNQLAGLDVDDALAARGILYAPDFVVNAGGIINLAEERGIGGYSHERALARAEQIQATTAAVLVRAHADGVPPGRAAETIARERIAREGKGHWRPQDSTPWRT